MTSGSASHGDGAAPRRSGRGRPPPPAELRAAARASRLDAVLVMRTTSWPSATNWGMSCVPIAPVAPATITFMGVSLLMCWRGMMRLHGLHWPLTGCTELGAEECDPVPETSGSCRRLGSRSAIRRTHAIQLPVEAVSEPDPALHSDQFTAEPRTASSPAGAIRGGFGEPGRAAMKAARWHRVGMPGGRPTIRGTLMSAAVFEVGSAVDEPAGGISAQTVVSGGPEALLTTKLYLPRPASGFVGRSRLMEKLDEGLARAVTLVRRRPASARRRCWPTGANGAGRSGWVAVTGRG